MAVVNRGTAFAAGLTALAIFVLPVVSFAALHACYLDHSPDAFNPDYKIKPAVAGHSLLVEFRARADEFGMTVGGPEWAQMKAIINDYEAYYDTKMAVIDGYRQTLEENELTEAEIQSIIDDIHADLKELDYRFIEDGFACRALIPDQAWANYEVWFVSNH
ncbi:MAG: hypothetical protein JSW52_10935 [Candidatus Coatesbacteria bacterium]|nr:MAG: hypothetical protein JSW52_10935 [Candidatus Coatesbacteria bacterium]